MATWILYIFLFQGSTIGDVGAAVCCTPCVNCQVAAEIKQQDGGCE